MNALPSSVSRTFRQIFSSVVMLTALLVMLVTGTALHGQSNRQGLITQTVNEANLVVLKGNTHPLATRANDRGAVPASMPADHMFLLLQRSPDRESALRAMIESLHDTNSPNFHKWLTPAQFAAQWGAADSDIATVTAWLQSHGFDVEGPTAGHTAIEFSGTAGEVQEAFHTAIHTFVVNGETHHANVSDPQIPAALAPVVAGISTLNDFHPRSMAQKGPRGVYDAKTHRIEKDKSSIPTVHPNLTVVTSDYDFLYVGPSDASIIYNTPNGSLNPNYPGNTIDGTGVKLGIVGDSDIDFTQNANYRKLFDLAPMAPTRILAGSADPGTNGDALEAFLDTEVSNGLAPGAKVFFYVAADTTTNYGINIAAVKAIDQNQVDILSLSFGECEGGLETSSNQQIESWWEQATAQGITVIVSTGDSGSAGCDDPDTQTVAYYGLQVNGYASTAYNVAVGGTDFGVLAGPDGSGANFTNYVYADNPDSGTLGSAISYIPEVPWNDSAANYPLGSYSNNVPYSSPYANITAAGGGKSNCSVGKVDQNGNLVCTSGYTKPAWQVAAGVPADKARDIPDLSFFAGNGYDYATWGICTNLDTDSNGNPVTDCTPDLNGDFYVTGVGGTSASAPAFAGMLALVDQATGDRQGQANYVLYNLARNHPAIFHDVTSGNNSVTCYAGTTNCTSKNSAGYYYLAGYNAGVGYDLASGLGSVDVTSMINNWSSVALKSTTTQLTASPTTIEHGQTIVANVNVTNEGDTAKGDVSLAASTKPQPLALGTHPLLLGGVTGNINLTDLPGGTYDLTATYLGTSTLSQSVSEPVAVTVTAEPSTTSFTYKVLNPSTGAVDTAATVPYGYYFDLTAEPYGNSSTVSGGVIERDGIATGSVVFTADSKALGTVTLASNGTAVINHAVLPVGSYPVVAAYSGDASFKPSSKAVTVHVVKAATQIVLTSNTTSYDTKAVVFTVKLSTGSGGVAPTGTVELKSGSTVLGTASIHGVAAAGAVLASGTVTISSSDFAAAKTTVTASYLGDENYDPSASNTITILGGASFELKSAEFALPAEHSTGSGFVVTTSHGGYAGTVDLTCKLISKTTSATPAECAMDPGSVTLTAGGTANPQILIFGKGTKLPTGVAANNAGKILGTGGAVLAFGLFFGIPARRRRWRNVLLGVLVMVSLSGFTGCVTQPKIITAGTYVFRVTGTDSKDTGKTATANITVEVL